MRPVDPCADSKRCSACRRTKPFSEFYKSQQKYVGGYYAQCKTCHKRTAMRYRDKNTPKISAYVKKKWAKEKRERAHTPISKLFWTEKQIEILIKLVHKFIVPKEGSFQIDWQDMATHKKFKELPPKTWIGLRSKWNRLNKKMAAEHRVKSRDAMRRMRERNGTGRSLEELRAWRASVRRGRMANDKMG